MEEKVLVTGATGLIGFSFIQHLLELQKNKSSFQIFGLIRDENKAKQLYKESYQKISFIHGDVTDIEIQETDFDYIIHAASCTSSKAFINEPVKVIMTNISGTYQMLELARKQKALRRFIFLSTMEVYGTPDTDEKIDEACGTDINTAKVRSCYPESKRACESLCIAYGVQFGIPVNILRLTQTFGPGVQYEDKRVFAEFARCVIEGKDIVLHTKGETKRNYLYTDDAAIAILCVMKHGIAGEIYNVANEDTYCSVFEMAKLVADKCAHGAIKVIIEEKDTADYGFAPTLHMNLKTDKLQSLGWKAKTGLVEMFNNTIEYMKKEKEIV